MYVYVWLCFANEDLRKSTSAAGSKVTDESDAGQAGTVAAVARESRLVDVGCWVFPLLSFSLESGPAIILEGGCCSSNSKAPRCAIRGDSSPPSVIDVAGAQGFFQAVLVSLPGSTSVSVSRRELTVQHDLRKAMVFHSRDMTSPAQLSFHQCGFDASSLCQLKNFDVGDKVIPVDV